MAGCVPYRTVHELLEDCGWVLQRTTKCGNELRRTYVSRTPGRPAISFPVRNRLVLRAYVERIRNILEHFPPEEKE